MVNTRPHSPAQDNVSSDEEYYEVIDKHLSTDKRDNELVIEATVHAPSLPQPLEDTELPFEEEIIQSEEAHGYAMEKDDANIEAATEFNLIEDNVRYETEIKERDAKILEMTLKQEDMDADVERYSTGVDTFNKEVQGRTKLEKNCFYLTVFDLLLALGIVAMANSVIWFVPAVIIIAKGLVIGRYMELNKKSRQALQKALKEAFPEIANSDLARASGVAYAANESDTAIEIADSPRVLEFGKKELSSFWHFGNSIGYVLGAPAETLGMKRGDEIVSINGVNVEALSHWEIRKMFKSVLPDGNVAVEIRFNPELLNEKETSWNRWTVIASIVVIIVVVAVFKVM